MLASGLKVSQVAWNVVFMRQLSVHMEASEWESWLEAMQEGNAHVEEADLAKLRCTGTVRAVQSILDSAPDKREQCQDAWRAIVDLLDKVCKSEWFSDMHNAFQEEVSDMRHAVLVGSQMHHSKVESQKAADDFKKRLHATSKTGSMHFNKVLSTSAAGLQLSNAICEVLAAQEKVPGWTMDLLSAMDQLNSLPTMLQDHFLNKDFDVIVPSASKVVDIQTKFGSLLQTCTDKFQSEHQISFANLKDFQEKTAHMIKTALNKRLFCKVPSLAASIAWVTNGCATGSLPEVDNHVKAIQAAKSLVSVRTQFAKYVGPDLAKSLTEYTADMQKFLAACDGFCNWLREAEADKKSVSISCFQSDVFVEWTKYFHESTRADPAATAALAMVFSVSDLHEDASKWMHDMKVWLAAWSQNRVTTKVASCQNFVSLLFQDGLTIDKICQESVLGSLDADEEPESIRSAIREFSHVACTVCFHDALRADFQFGETKIDLQSLCAANIYLPAARYTTAVLAGCDKIVACTSIAKHAQSQNMDEFKKSGGSRTESASSLLAMFKKWLQARAVQQHQN